MTAKRFPKCEIQMSIVAVRDAEKVSTSGMCSGSGESLLIQSLEFNFLLTLNWMSDLVFTVSLEQSLAQEFAINKAPSYLTF